MTHINPAFNEPISEYLSYENLREWARNKQRNAQRKVSEKPRDDAIYWGGYADAYFDLLCYMIGKTPVDVDRELKEKVRLMDFNELSNAQAIIDGKS